ncbi:GTPase-activating protein-like protein GYP5 [Amniculicola lignicola CBS 123094]|uniref:GTPase-activating protein GYP5 n=1 Tax=Amniculicola lignicola CBS 123094 TaxID=1392246 RepID=A0A6A5WCP6_9PLEO|nr:GTPase-activating protein-like protein GYP5 [Amniculicola lignicola CBS 123094]
MDKERQPASGNSSDREGETFEDAAEITARPNSHSTSSRSRSLLSRRESSSSTAAKARPESEVPELPTAAGADADSQNGSSEADDDQSTPDKSPLLTSHRISVTSDMDDVSLEENIKSPPPPKLPPREPSEVGLQGFTGRMSPVKFPPPPPPPAFEKRDSLPPPPAPSRKLTSPFSWLSRNTSSKKPESPPLPSADRRNTNASIATIGSNPELTLSKDEGGHAHNNRSSQSSLKDRFKFLRMREEAGIAMGDEGVEPGHAGALAGLIGRTGLGIGISSPGSVHEEREDGITSGPTSPRPGSLPKTATINPSLAPGTAAGMALGPNGDSAEPVDWDLWQTVVNEGPAAVARTSPEELNRAIASGIPQAIRGVIWQVLAQSKNEELETMYRELVARGTDKGHMTMRTPNLNGHANGTGKEKDSVASSSSSMHSDYSTPATTTGSAHAPLPSPSIGSDNADDVIKLQAKLALEKKQRTKDEHLSIQKLEKVIKRDLGARTSYSKYLMAAGLQDGLFGICKAYALYDESVGYAQGMNFIAMPLLFNMPEEEAFSLFVTLMNKYNLRDLFIQDMPGLHLHLYQFERLLEDLEPALYCHLHRREVKPQLYATQWFLTLFAYRFPLQLVLRIYDLILSDGLEGAILKFGIVLMQKNAEALLAMKDMATLTTFLKEKIFDVYIDKAPSASSILESGFFGHTGGVDKEIYRADTLVRDAVAVKVTPEMLKQYTAEWKEQQRIEKERETELHGLRDKVSSLKNKVHHLERRAEQSDTEHVQVASELVKTHVENENLSDENETLKTKVEELQKIVNTQPEEVEARLKTEMETVMQKNIVVHNENRALEEQMAEMEKELVATKMQWATLNEEHETLKQKWNNVSQMMNR